MQKLIEGFKKFQTEVFRSKKGLFDRLAHQQHPRALFITCSDSRIDPCLLTQTEPGERFILRNGWRGAGRSRTDLEKRWTLIGSSPDFRHAARKVR